jgi:hypothetical protein
VTTELSDLRSARVCLSRHLRLKANVHQKS